MGICCGVHDSSAAIISNGCITAAAQEERFTRIKQTGAFPENSIRYCLATTNIDINDLSAVGFFWQPWRGLLRRAMLLAGAFPRTLTLRATGHARGSPRTWLEFLRIRKMLMKSFGYKGQVRYLSHQECHASSTFFPSPFEEAAILCLDLTGEIDSTFAGLGRGNRLHRLWTTKYPHSLGSYYATITQYLGYLPATDEYRIMGLASYGRPSYYRKFRELVELRPHGQFRLNTDYFVHHWGQSRWYSNASSSVLALRGLKKILEEMNVMQTWLTRHSWFWRRPYCTFCKNSVDDPMAKLVSGWWGCIKCSYEWPYSLRGTLR